MRRNALPLRKFRGRHGRSASNMADARRQVERMNEGGLARHWWAGLLCVLFLRRSSANRSAALTPLASQVVSFELFQNRFQQGLVERNLNLQCPLPFVRGTSPECRACDMSGRQRFRFRLVLELVLVKIFIRNGTALFQREIPCSLKKIPCYRRGQCSG